MAAQLAAEHERLAWLDGLLPVPEVLAWVAADDRGAAEADVAFLLTAPVPGTPATDPDNHQDPDALILALAAGLRRVHDLPVDRLGGPVGVDPRVERARAARRRGLVDRRDFEPAYARFTPNGSWSSSGTHGPTGPRTWSWSTATRRWPTCSWPSTGGELAVTGYVDVDRAGVADRYLDLAIVARSLASNLSPEALGPFFHAYGIEAPTCQGRLLRPARRVLLIAVPAIRRRDRARGHDRIGQVGLAMAVARSHPDIELVSVDSMQVVPGHGHRHGQADRRRSGPRSATT